MNNDFPRILTLLRKERGVSQKQAAQDLGVFLRHIPASEVLQQLRPWVLGGFAAIFVSGGLLFWAEAATVVASPPFPFKLGFIVLAGLISVMVLPVALIQLPAVESPIHQLDTMRVRVAGASVASCESGTRSR